jgi:large subunit ribosomal protein L19
MMIQSFKPEQLKDMPVLKAGYVVRVHQKIKDVSPDGKEKERIQIFEGTVIATKGGKAINGTFTVRKISSGVGVERIFPVHSPNIEKIEIVKSAPVRKAKLYYSRTGQEARIKEPAKK